MSLNKLRNKVQLCNITSLLQRVFPTSRFTAFGHKMSWRVTYLYYMGQNVRIRYISVCTKASKIPVMMYLLRLQVPFVRREGSGETMYMSRACLSLC